jgi:ribosome-interacting GTPase 1
VFGADAITIEELDLVSKIPHHVPISANHLWNLDELLERIWEYLGMIRIYTKPKCVCILQRVSACVPPTPLLTDAGDEYCLPECV